MDCCFEAEKPKTVVDIDNIEKTKEQGNRS